MATHKNYNALVVQWGRLQDLFGGWGRSTYNSLHSYSTSIYYLFH